MSLGRSSAVPTAGSSAADAPLAEAAPTVAEGENVQGPVMTHKAIRRRQYRKRLQERVARAVAEQMEHEMPTTEELDIVGVGAVEAEVGSSGAVGSYTRRALLELASSATARRRCRRAKDTRVFLVLGGERSDIHDGIWIIGPETWFSWTPEVRRTSSWCNHAPVIRRFPTRDKAVEEWQRLFPNTAAPLFDHTD